LQQLITALEYQWPSGVIVGGDPVMSWSKSKALTLL